MDALTDLRYSARSFTRAPGLGLILLLTIALGIGSNAAVFGFVRGLLAPALPLPGIESIVSLFTRDAQGAFTPLTFDSYLALRSQNQVFETLGAAQESRRRLVLGERSSLVPVATVTTELARLLQLPEGDGAVVSDRLWRSELAGSTPADLRIAIDGIDMPVAGVAPAWLEGLVVGRTVDVWLPLDEGSIQGPNRQTLTFSVLGRLRGELSAEQAESV